jgi:peptidoglycan/LPS O-acetylase OafA/YrhL
MSERRLHLEFVRGVAALVVVAFHCCFGFFPEFMGIVPEQPAGSGLPGNPLYIFVNGPAAVQLFFVLSGYVLTRSYFEKGDDKKVIRSALKRWPRLAGPVTISTLLSCVLFLMGLYHFRKAGQLVQSPWLERFAYGLSPGIEPKASMSSAFLQGSVLTFFRGDCWYNSSIWTMKAEFFGSFAAFSMAAVAVRMQPTLRVGLFVLSAVAAYLLFPALVPFIAGVALAMFLPNCARPPQALVVCLILFFAFAALGYPGTPIGAYRSLSPLRGFAALVPAFGALLLIGYLELSAGAAKFLDGSLSRFLGELSFPLYLIHVPIICSLGARIYLDHGPYAALLASVVVSLLAAMALIPLDRLWLRFLTRAAKAVV